MSVEKLREEMNQYKKGQEQLIDQLIQSHKELSAQMQTDRKKIERLQNQVRKLQLKNITETSLS